MTDAPRLFTKNSQNEEKMKGGSQWHDHPNR
nr:MAG TPA: hypothetical protein [Caudoviricetes sp.]